MESEELEDNEERVENSHENNMEDESEKEDD